MPDTKIIIPAQSLFRRYKKEINNPALLVNTAGKGLEMQFFDQLIKLTGMNKKELAGIIDATPKTIDNRRLGKRRLGRIESEQLLQLLVLYKKGEEVFANIDAFAGWLRKPAVGLGGNQPFQLIHSPQGINMVMDELSRIEYGALA